MTVAGQPGLGRVRRFARPVRAVHRVTAVLMTVCIVTAAFLYVPTLEVIGGHRHLLEQVHVWSGLALPVPIVLGFLFPAYRSDARRLNRLTPADWQWLRSRTRRDGAIPVGKFNAGQKLNVSLSAGAILVLLGTGTVMCFTRLVRLDWRAGATFVHDWSALALGLLVLGHVAHALRDEDSRAGMRTGDVPLRWARRHHGAWADEVAGRETSAAQAAALSATADQRPVAGTAQAQQPLGVPLLGEVADPGLQHR